MRTFEERVTKRELTWAGIFCLVFVVLQIFQRFVFVSVPLGADPLAALQTLNDPMHIARSVGVLLSIALLMLPFTVFAQAGPSPVARTLVVVFFALFVTFELGYRSTELFVVQLQWGFTAVREGASDDLLTRFALFQDVKQAIYFPLLLSHGIASGLAGWFVPYRGINRLLKAALLLNALRLALRIGGMFAGIQWMDVLTGTYYFPFMLTIFIPITVWCFLRSRSA